MVIINAADLRALKKAAEAAWPSEACALLEGTRDGDALSVTVTVTRVHPADNVATDPTRRFEADPHLLFLLHRELRNLPTKLVGVWHSHPDGSAQLSETDLARAWDPNLVWLLTPVVDQRAVGTSAFRVREADKGNGQVGAFVPLDIYCS